VFITDGGAPEAVDAFAGEDERGVFMVARLEADGGLVRFEEDLLEGGFVRIGHADEAVVAAGNRQSGGEDDDISLVVPGFHRVADDADSEGVGVVEVGATDVFVGAARGITFVVVVHGVASGDVVDDGYEFAGGVDLFNIFAGFAEEVLEFAGRDGVGEGGTGVEHMLYK